MVDDLKPFFKPNIKYESKKIIEIKGTKQAKEIVVTWLFFCSAGDCDLGLSLSKNIIVKKGIVKKQIQRPNVIRNVRNLGMIWMNGNCKNPMKSSIWKQKTLIRRINWLTDVTKIDMTFKP